MLMEGGTDGHRVIRTDKPSFGDAGTDLKTRGTSEKTMIKSEDVKKRWGKLTARQENKQTWRAEGKGFQMQINTDSSKDESYLQCISRAGVFRRK